MQNSWISLNTLSFV